MKIHVTGNSGAGKTSFAQELGAMFNLPVFGLDKVVWQKGWRKTPSDQRIQLQEALMDRPAWVIEGVSAQVRQAADIVIFLDVPRPVAYVRALRRNLPYLFKSRPDLPEDCPEYKLLLPHLKLVWAFKHKTRPNIVRDLHMCPNKYLVVKTKDDRRAAIRELDRQMASQQVPSSQMT